MTGALPSDEELMAAVRDGALDRLAELFRRHALLLHTFFRRRANDALACEDLVQETFLRVLQYRQSWRGDGSFAGWLFRLAANLDLDRRSRRRREPAAAAAAEERGDAQDSAAAIAAPAAAAPDLSLERAEASARLFGALARLDRDARAIVELRWFEGLAAEAIGARLGCTPGAARVRLHRAHARLLALYSGEGELPGIPARSRT